MQPEKQPDSGWGYVREYSLLQLEPPPTIDPRYKTLYCWYGIPNSPQSKEFSYSNYTYASYYTCKVNSAKTGFVCQH